MKIAVLGVGSFVFGPSVLHDAIVEHRFADLHLALFDPNQSTLQLMSGVAHCMAQAVGLSVRITIHGQLSEALDGADFVVSAAAVQLAQRFQTDYQIIRQHYPDHLILEFGGVAGISYTLRQVALYTDIAGQMLQHCPKAWLLTSSNPLPRVCEAVHRMGVRVAGFCNNASQVFEAVGRVLLGVDEVFPWSQASARFSPTLAGVNHLTWLLSLMDRQTGLDVSDQFVQHLRKGAGGIAAQRPLTMQLLAQFGHYPPNGDDHMADFLPPSPHVQSIQSSSHGTAQQRQQRMQLLEEVAAGKAPYSQALDQRAWEKPMDFIAAIANGQETRFLALNLVNQGQLPQLPAGVFVETPAIGSNHQVTPIPCHLPPPLAALCRSTAELHSLLTQAAINHDYPALTQAIDLDPTILDKSRARLTLRYCMFAHHDLIGVW